MTTSSIDGPQRSAARIAGFAGLFSFVIVVAVNFGIFARLIVAGDSTRTAANIAAHETLFRVGIAGDLLYCAAVVILSAALYVILKPVDRNLALVAMLGRLVHSFTWLLVSLNLLTALRLLDGAEYARAFPPEQLPVLVRLYLSGFDHYYVGLLFWSLGGTIGAFLWLKSRYISRSLAAFGVVASAWCAVCTFVLFLYPAFPRIVNLWLFDVPMALFELALSFVLLFRGLEDGSRA